MSIRRGTEKLDILEQIGASKIIAIIRLDDLSGAVELSQALLAGGVRVIEFTLTNPNAEQAIAMVRMALGDAVLIGAGSVITPEQVEQVANCGAQFVVSPVTKQSVIEACHQYDLPNMPGAYTPTEIQAAWEMGAAAVKVFPARGLGSKYIKDILAPLPHLRLIPTGGIGINNIAAFTNAGVFAVGVGGALCNKNAIAVHDWETIVSSARQLCEAIS